VSIVCARAATDTSASAIHPAQPKTFAICFIGANLLCAFYPLLEPVLATPILAALSILSATAVGWAQELGMERLTMDRLVQGHKRFLDEIFPGRQAQFHLLAEGQRPGVLFVTCADSRIVPDLILQTQPGDLFICRNAGNVIPRCGEPAGGVSATIEYAVEVLRVRHLIVCGHSDCGVIGALLAPESIKDLPSVRDWLQHVEPAWEHVDQVERRSGELTRHTALAHANILAQLHNLQTHSYVRRALAEGRLAVYGWYYDILTGRIEQYDEQAGRFLPLEG
jgi:carbonic anhydrase